MSHGVSDAASECFQLHCVECGKGSEGTAKGWKAYICGGFEDEPIQVGAFCPDCASREFGELV